MCATDRIRAQDLGIHKGKMSSFFVILKKPYKSRAQDMGTAQREKY
jgi:hypothetical protein